MNDIRIYPAGNTKALQYAAKELARVGHILCSRPEEASHVLLPTPSFEAPGWIKGGLPLADLLAQVSNQVVLIGGNMNDPMLSNYRTIDLLQDPVYLAKNAAITAYCGIKYALNNLEVTLDGCPVLILGWGRIGKCLADLLKGMGARVSVAARKETDRALLWALGYEALDPANIPLSDYRVIYNTVPEMLCPNCPDSVLKIDLASRPGIGGEHVIWARGLPNKDAPESSGKLIAERVLALIDKEN